MRPADFAPVGLAGMSGATLVRTSMSARAGRRIAPASDDVADPASAARAVATIAAARAAGLDHDGAFPVEDLRELADVGLLAAPVPRSHGGAGLGAEPGAAALREVLRLVGLGSLPLGRVYEGHVNAIDLIVRYADAGTAARLFADARAGHLFGVWNTGPAEGGLILDAGRGLLAGCKTFASGAGHVTRALVTARTEAHEPAVMLVVPLEPGTRADVADWRAHGMRASATGTVDFTGLPASSAETIGKPGDYEAQPHFSGGAWRFLAVQCGGIEAVVEAWRTHLRQTGRGEDPHQLARLGEGAIAAETATLWVEAAARRVVGDAASDPEGTVAYVNLARLAVERAGLDVIEGAQRSVGLQGFLRDHPLERLIRDLATYLRQPAPDRALAAGARHVLAAPGAVGDLWPRAGPR